MSSSRYAPPQSAVADHAHIDVAHAEALRREYLATEFELRSAGNLFLLAGIVCGLSFVALVVAIFAEGRQLRPVPAIYLATLCTLFVVAAFTVGIGLRRLRPWVRVPGTILSIIGLLGLPLGTVINAIILYRLHNRRGRVVLARSYRAVIEATPHITYRRTVGDKIASGILFALFAGLLVQLVDVWT
ncbi:hypothetical protein [Tahibacter amnicola]|uniref:Uncharacterized protein n=1 Tax=Tahibacter amnicola TaxID=2976241 RepID=A0ABY6BDB4_9GAMM|nr:hypothetical protein [Tahibacter amnicola]UXI68018.1 hypothetical protein N4264_25385 [Tahibacter amnicola]